MAKITVELDEETVRKMQEFDEFKDSLDVCANSYIRSFIYMMNERNKEMKWHRANSHRGSW